MSFPEERSQRPQIRANGEAESNHCAVAALGKAYLSQNHGDFGADVLWEQQMRPWG